MSDFDAVNESDDDDLSQGGQDNAGSSDDLRSALEAATREVSERQRDEQGRFARQQEAQQAAAPAAAPAPEKRQAESQNQTAPTSAPAPQQQAAAPAAPRAPDSWSPAAKAKFATLPPDVQAEISRREADVHKGFTAQDEQRQFGKSMSEVINPYLPIIRAEGGNPVAAVQDLLQTAYTLRTAPSERKQELFIGLAKQFGVDMNGVFQRLSGQAQPQVHPQVAQMQQQLAQLQQERLMQQQAAQQQEKAQIDQTIESFASDPKNVYFANVKAEMAALLRENRAKDLQEAYDMACWARPDIRPLLLQQQEQQRQADARARATRARAAGSSVSGSPSGSAVAPGATDPNASLRDTIRAAMQAHRADAL